MNEHFTARVVCPCCTSSTVTELRRISYDSDLLQDYLYAFYSPQGFVEPAYLRDQEYILVECNQCGLIYQREIPNDFLMWKLYEEWIDPQKCFELHEKPRGIDYFSHLSREIVGIVRLLQQPPMALKFLDFSMGWGHWCRIAQSFGCTVHGTEFSEARQAYARSQGVEVIDYEEIAANRYDFINTEQVFEHLPEIRQTLAYLASSLKPQGLLKISVPNGWDIKRRLAYWDWRAAKGSQNSLNPVAPLEHINCFNHASLVTLAQQAGLRLVGNQQLVFGQQPLGMAGKVKAILRPAWHRLRGIESEAAAEGTYLLFQRVGQS